MDEKKRIVIENYPVHRLPEEIRAQFGGDEEVILTVETRGSGARRRTISEILEATRQHRALTDDPVARVRAFRGSSAHRDRLHARIRREGKP